MLYTARPQKSMVTTEHLKERFTERFGQIMDHRFQAELQDGGESQDTTKRRQMLYYTKTFIDSTMKLSTHTLNHGLTVITPLLL